MAPYLRGLLKFQFPDQLSLLSHAGEGTGGRGGSRGKGRRGHTWLVVETHLLLEICL